MSVAPQVFYRVQHGQSYTKYREGRFSANGHYHLDLSHWVNKEKFESHLDWNARPLDPSPYISIFDNLADATKRAQSLTVSGRSRVFIARIQPGRLQKKLITIGKVCLPVWQTPESEMFIATVDVRKHLHVRLEISQASEWFAVSEVPEEMITVL